MDGNGQHLSDQISEIDLSDPEDARVLMPEQGTDILAHFGADHFMERYQRYKAHIAEWRQQYPKLAEVDLRYEQQVVLQMTGGANAAPATVERERGDWLPLESRETRGRKDGSKGRDTEVCAAEACREHQSGEVAHTTTKSQTENEGYEEEDACLTPKHTR